MFNHLKNWRTVLRSGCPLLHPHQPCRRFCSPHPGWHLSASHFGYCHLVWGGGECRGLFMSKKRFRVLYPAPGCFRGCGPLNHPTARNVFVTLAALRPPVRPCFLFFFPRSLSTQQLPKSFRAPSGASLLGLGRSFCSSIQTTLLTTHPAPAPLPPFWIPHARWSPMLP